MTNIIDELRDALRRLDNHGGIFDPPSFRELLRDRVQQLGVDMVDGVALDPAEATALRSAVWAFVSDEALQQLPATRALAVLEMMEAFGYEVDAGRRRVGEDATEGHPPPEPLVSPEVDALRSAAEQHPDACELGEPIAHLAFMETYRAEGLALPDELLRLLAVCDGLDLSCLAASYLPVFSLLSSASFDVLEPEDGYPKRLAVFQGGDEVELAVYSDDSGLWWLTLEYEYAPEARIPFDLPALLRFGLARFDAEPDELYETMSWGTFFG